MLTLSAVLLGILFTDVVNPVLLAGTVYSLGSRRPYATAMSLIAGHTLVYFAAGILLGVGFEAIEEYLRNPRPVDFVIQTGLGLLLLFFGVRSIRPERKPQDRDFGDARAFGPGSAFVLGGIINLMGIPFAVPYFAALGQILKAELGWTGSLTVLATYNVLYAVPFLALVGARWIWRERSQQLLERINAIIDKIAAVLMPLLLLGLGGTLLADSAAYFITGTPLIQL